MHVLYICALNYLCIFFRLGELKLQLSLAMQEIDQMKEARDKQASMVRFLSIKIIATLYFSGLCCLNQNNGRRGRPASLLELL